MTKVVQAALLIAAAVYLAIAAVTFFPDLYWPFETLSNLRVQIAICGIFGIAALLLARLRIPAFVITCATFALIFAALNTGERMAAVAKVPANLRVMTINIGFANRRDDEKLVSMIKSANPDVLVLIQDFPEARRAIAQRVGTLPYHAEAGIDLRAVSIDSRYPITQAQIESRDYVAHVLTSVITVPVGKSKREVFFVATHPTVPLRGWMASQRKTALTYLAGRVCNVQQPTIVAGDFNATPQSVLFARLIYSGGLADAVRSRLPQPTWMSDVPGLGLRIDHVLVSPDIAVARRSVGDDFGSDHRPVTVDLVIPPLS